MKVLKYIIIAIFLFALLNCTGSPAGTKTDIIEPSASETLDCSDDDNSAQEINSDQNDEAGIFSGEGEFFKHDPSMWLR